MRGVTLAMALLLASGAAVWAEPPRVSPRPMPRPQHPAMHPMQVADLVPIARPEGAIAAVRAALAEATASAAPATSPRPGLRPALPRPTALVPPAATASTASAAPDATPAAKPRGLAALFAPRTPRTRQGTVCNDPDIEGSEIAAIQASVAGCGLSGGVSVTAVAGIRLSEPARIDCTTAQALKTWVEEGVVPAIGRRGGGLVALEVVASYQCRPRNNVPGARVSEHGAGRAVDVAGFVLADGSTLNVARDWNRETKIMRAIHASACGPFGTVLGPKADANHQDHFHVDTARYRSGSYCR